MTKHTRSPAQWTEFLLFAFFGMFLFAGLWFFGLGLREKYQLNEFKRQNRAATGVVSNYFDTMEILVTYRTANGEEIYAMPKNVFWLRPAIGSRIRLWYNPSQPLEVVTLGGTASFMLGGMIALVIFGGVGAAGLYYFWRQRQSRLWLYRHGQRVTAVFVRSHWIGNLTYKVYAEWKDSSTGQTYTFSGYVYSPRSLRELEERQLVSVLINPDDPEQYYMEIQE